MHYNLDLYYILYGVPNFGLSQMEDALLSGLVLEIGQCNLVLLDPEGYLK
jgi:hypothetical protein